MIIGENMKKIMSLIILLSILIFIILYRNAIVTHIINNWIYTKEIVIKETNQYTHANNYDFVQITDNFYPKNKQDLLNIIYTYLNNGWQEFTFYCSEEYKDCLTNTTQIINDKTILSNINNFVHPYNSYSKLYIETNNLGKITIKKEKLYTEEEITQLNIKIDEILATIITPNMTTKEKIKAIHDYIINHTIYDQESANNVELSIENPETLASHKAIGPLIYGLGICGGYSDTMAIFLNKLGIQNYKIANESHVWNLINLDGTWYHLDLTWDDPVLDTKENILIDDFFLISTNELHQKDPKKHLFNTTIYKEAS